MSEKKQRNVCSRFKVRNGIDKLVYVNVCVCVYDQT